MQRATVYAGTFDVLTFGHLWMIERGAQLFDRLIVAIGVNPKKQCLFSIEDRVEALQKSTTEFRNVEVATFPFELLIHYASSVDAQNILRGIRDENDYRFESAMRNINADLNPDITAVFLMPPRELKEVSSSMVKELVGSDGWEKRVEPFVPYPVFSKLKEAHERKII